MPLDTAGAALAATHPSLDNNWNIKSVYKTRTYIKVAVILDSTIKLTHLFIDISQDTTLNPLRLGIKAYGVWLRKKKKIKDVPKERHSS